MRHLTKTQFTLDVIKKHLDVQVNTGPMIENFLVGHLLVVAYSEIEQKVSDIFSARMTVENDRKLSDFIKKTNKSMMKRVKKSDIKEMAKNFGDDSQKDFIDHLSDDEIRAYSNIIENRHSTAHSTGHQLRLSDLETGIDAAEKVLDALAIAIR